jgi:hypothetical protein
MKMITKKEMEPILEDMVKRGLIKEGPIKDGQRTWYIPDEKEEAIEEELNK